MTVDLQNMTVPEDGMAELGAKIAQHPTLSHHSSPAVLSRMLLARHLHVDDAYVLWEGWAAWREDEKPELIDEASVAPQLAVQTVSVTGMDKSGRTCVILRTRNHVPGQFPFEDMLRLTIWVLETSTSRSVKTSGTGYITAIWDCKGQGFRNLDTALATHKPGIIHIMKVGGPRMGTERLHVPCAYASPEMSVAHIPTSCCLCPSLIPDPRRSTLNSWAGVLSRVLADPPHRQQQLGLPGVLDGHLPLHRRAD